MLRIQWRCQVSGPAHFGAGQLPEANDYRYTDDVSTWQIVNSEVLVVLKNYRYSAMEAWIELNATWRGGVLFPPCLLRNFLLSWTKQTRV